MSKYARQKGHNFERECAQLMREIGYKECITARAGDRSKDNQGQDLLNTGSLIVQCKNMQKYAPATILEQIQHSEGYIPVVFSKAVRKEPIAILYLQDFLDLINLIE